MNSTELPSDPTPPASPPISAETSVEPSASPTVLAEPVEMVRKIYVRDLRDKERIHTVFRVSAKNRHVARSGKAFLQVSLVDRTGEVDARIFDHADELEPKFVSNDYILIEGHVISFHGKPQVVIEKLERLDPEPIDPVEFTPPPAPAAPPQPTPTVSNVAPPRAADDSSASGGAAAVGQISDLVDRVQDPHVKALLRAFLDDPAIAEGLKVAPAAKGIHHAYRGGLAEHILSVMRLAHRMADHYPMADRDLVLAGALLHDIGKVQELSYENGNFDYTDEGRLVGHLVMTAQKIREKTARIEGFPPLLEQHLTHLVLAHHGQLEYGSPKLPVTIEALIVHAIDSLDSKIASWLEVMARDPNERWTDVVRLYDRHLWKGPVPTIRNRAPVEGRKRSRPSERRKHRGAVSEPKVERHERLGPEVSKTKPLAFKPLSALTASTSASSPETPASSAPSEAPKEGPA